MRITVSAALSTLAVAAAAVSLAGAAQAQDTIKIGWAISKTGPFAPGAGITTLPNYQVWVKDVNDAGGINVGGKKMKIEVIEYDDRSNSEEMIMAVERLATQDKVDFILPPWSTGMNLAAARRNRDVLDRRDVAEALPDMLQPQPTGRALLRRLLRGVLQPFHRSHGLLSSAPDDPRCRAAGTGDGAGDPRAPAPRPVRARP